MLGLLLGLLALGLPAPPAFAEVTGISGKVTDATTHAPIEGIEACAFSTAEEGPLEEEAPGSFGCATTDSSGDYTIPGLSAGSFAVAFSTPFLSTLNYVSQFYDGKESPSEAATVTVIAGAVTSGVNAVLEPGAEISGKVSEASTGAPVEGILVCAIGPIVGTGPSELANCTRSAGGGEYALLGLRAGSYKVVFLGNENLAPQSYNGKAHFAEAELVAVGARGLTSGINAALLPASPSSTTSSTSSPTGPAGGSGSQIPGVMPTRVARSGISLLSRRIVVQRDGNALVRLRCVGTAGCHGKLTLTTKARVKVGHRTLVRTVLLTSSARLSIGAGGSMSASIRLDRAGEGLLAAGRGHLNAHLAFLQSGATLSQVQIRDVLLLTSRH
ncbi:MAG: MSCRAMM family protein [Solirubrobacteraceae bacterium]